MFALLLTEGMDPFYQNISSFPTVFFTFFLLLSIFFWAVAVLGLVDIDILDVDLPNTEGSFELGELSNANPNVLAGLLMKFGLQGVPVTVIITSISLIGWIISYYSVHYVVNLVPDGILHFLVGIPVLLVALLIATLMTSVIIKPIRPLFKKAQQETVKHVLGKTAIVRTSKVDHEFGEVILEDGGAGLIFKVRACGDEVFKKGDKVVLLEYLKEEHLYRVVSEQEFLGSSVDT